MQESFLYLRHFFRYFAILCQDYSLYWCLQIWCRNSDLILVMDEGKIVERGSHKKLIEHSGVYAGLIETLSGESELSKLTLR